MKFFRACILTLTPLLCLSSSLFAQRDLKVIPPPDPELERETFILPEGFEVNLFAADPQIAKPIQMNFDPQGRLWIASSETYPHIEPGAKANDKILYLQDLDGDGVSDKTQIFTDGLLIPTAVAYGNDGVYVGASTELLHFKDTNGDGTADEKQIIFSGFGTEDTHHIIHTLRYGPDAHLYFNQSIYIHSHIETPWGIRRLNAGGIWRFRPETLELSVFARGLVNPWGTDFNRYGQTFATDGAGGEGINYIVPGAYYLTSYGAQRILHGLNPGSPKHCGLEVVESEHLPADWQGSLITNDFRGHRVCRFVLSEDGSGYRSQEQQEVIKSDHVAFRPVDVKQGPDGAIYIADWYNPIIQHGEVDFRDPRRDHTHGRIWRITYTGKPTSKPVDLTQLSTPELLEKVDSSNRFSRDQAKVVLKERGEEILPHVQQWLANNADQPGADQRNLEGLWMYQSLGQLEANLLTKCLQNEDHRIRAAAVRAAGQRVHKVSDPLELLGSFATDEHPQVRLEAVRALAEVKAPASIAYALQALNHDMDEFLDYALWLTCRELEPYWTPALLSGELVIKDPPQALPFLLRATGSTAGTSTLVEKVKAGSLSGSALGDALAVIADIGNADQLGAVFDLALADGKSPAEVHSLLHTLYAAAVNRKVVPQRELNQVGGLVNSADPSVRMKAIECLGAWKLESQRELIAAQISLSERNISERANSIRALAAFSDQPAAQQLTQIAKGEHPLPLRRVAIEELYRFRPQQGANLSVPFLKAASAAESQPLFQTVLQRKGAGDLLAKAIGEQQLPKDVAVVGARVLSSSGQQDSQLAKLLRIAGSLNQDPIQLSPEDMQKIVAEIREQGDPAIGEAIFRRGDLNCMKCHAVGPAGGIVGSNLVSLGATAQPDYIVESLLDPNAKVKEGYHTVVVATDEGKIYSGVKARETDSELFLRDAEGKELSIPKNSIEEQKQGASLMPAGLTSNITHQEFVHLAAFLHALGREADFTISTVPVVRHWEAIQSTPEAAYQFRRISYAAAASDNSAFQWARVYSHIDGSLFTSDLPEMGIRNRIVGGNRGMSFVRTKVKSSAGDLTFTLNAPTGLQIWIDAKPVDAAKEVQLSVEAGEHQITIAVDRSLRTSPIVLKPVLSPETAQVELPTGQ